ncbi:MAG: hypothetical protein LUB59_07170 [Candidatus Gastranaerophilales bacterium]|nr:hypothetical protein [Candidatus Gastranaerophilales bacterium]
MNVVNKLLTALGHSTNLHYDKWADCRKYVSGHKKWIANILPYELLERNIKSSVEAILTLCECEEFYHSFPETVSTPNYGDKWGRCANYIELNNRAIAEMRGDRCSNGILSSIKMLPAIPPSAKSWANCVILSQIFPNIYGDGYNKGVFEENSIYGIRLNAGYSSNIIDFSIVERISPEEQLQVFNHLANFRGIKTGIRTVISADQIKAAYYNRSDENFNWKNSAHQELFIQEHVKLVDLGFECFFIDSAKHIGGYDCGNYSGVGALPEYSQMQYIIDSIRKRSGNTHLSFVGEKSTGDFERYKNLGLTTGTAFISSDDFNSVKNWSMQFKYNREYAPGIEVSNDNDNGGSRYEDRLNRINTCLFAYEYPSDKLPTFMQTEDLFPLRYDTSTHHLMMTNPSYSTDGTPLSHWKNLFSTDDAAAYNAKVGELFSHALNL